MKFVYNLPEFISKFISENSLEGEVAGKNMTGIMWWVFENSAIFFPVDIFPSHK